MAKYTQFEELPVWQQAARLYNRVLDLLDSPNLALSPSFRNQLDRAALSISNNIAEGFERVTSGELVSFLSIARGSAGEVRSMMAVIKERPKLRAHATQLQEIREMAESCTRQITAWNNSLESSPMQGKRYPTGEQRRWRDASEKAREFRIQFLRSLKPGHALYNSSEARAARGEEEADKR